MYIIKETWICSLVFKIHSKASCST